MKRLSQRDLRWAKQKLGKSNLTIGRFGCTTTCISMITDYFGNFTDPLSISRQAQHYTNDGLIIWKTFPEFAKRGYGQNDKDIQDSLNDKNKAVILEVNNGSHWVVAIRKTLFSKNNYIVADPWFGKDVNCKNVYRNITGYALFHK